LCDEINYTNKISKDSYLDLLKIKFRDGIQVILKIHSLERYVECYVHFDVQERYQLRITIFMNGGVIS
jgi:hypothetical protein